MKWMIKTQQFFKKYSTPVDRAFLWLTLLTLLCGGALSVLNNVFFHYPTTLLFETNVNTLSWMQLIILCSLCVCFLFYGMYIRRLSPHASTFLWGIGLFSASVLASVIIVNGIQGTPFKPIDPHLVTADRLFGLDSANLMHWTHDHPHIHHALTWIYNAIIFELIGVPFFLTLFNGRRALSIFYLGFMLTSLIGCLIYYFFPTMAPSGIIHSPYFSIPQQHTSLRFTELHQYIRPAVSDGGLIAFPSFHVIWAVLLTYACRARKIIFIPMIIFNTLLIASTVMLGWHYLVDAMAGIAIAVAAIVWAERLTQKSMALS